MDHQRLEKYPNLYQGFNSLRISVLSFQISVQLFLLRERSSEVKFFFRFLQKSAILLKSSDFSGVDHILHIIDGLLLKYEMMIFFPGNLSGFRIFSAFSESFENFRILLILTRVK